MEKTAYSLQEAFYRLGLGEKPKPASMAKRCACGRSYTRRAFLRLPKPSGGGQMHGVYWRNCVCGSTLVIDEVETN